MNPFESIIAKGEFIHRIIQNNYMGYPHTYEEWILSEKESLKQFNLLNQKIVKYTNSKRTEWYKETVPPFLYNYLDRITIQNGKKNE